MINRSVLKLWLRICAVVAGTSAALFTTSCLGDVIRLEKHPSLKIASYSVSPLKQVPADGKLTVTCSLNDNSIPVRVSTKLEGVSSFDFQESELYDDGTNGDQTAGDGVWTVDLQLYDRFNSGEKFVVSTIVWIKEDRYMWLKTRDKTIRVIDAVTVSGS